MSRPPRLSRRGFAALVLGGAALWGDRAPAQTTDDVDRGLGGTGAAPLDPEETLGQDRGIGGTGVIGTIRRFGSIVVNDLRVAFPADVRVTIDGRPARPSDLRLGHVVRVLARGREGALETRAIVARSEVVGPLDPSAGRVLAVLGQRVELAEGVVLPAHRPGDLLAVSGLRRLDGTIVASLVERRPPGRARLHGPVAVGAGGRPAIGGLPVLGLAAGLVGRRVTVIGARHGAAFRASSVEVEPRVPFSRAAQLSVEAYVAREPGGLRLGSGLSLDADAALRAEVDHGALRAVVLARPAPGGRLDAESLRVETGPRREGPNRGPPAVEAPGRPGAAPDGPARPGAPGGPDGATRGPGPAGGRGGPPGGGGAGGGRGR